MAGRSGPSKRRSDEETESPPSVTSALRPGHGKGPLLPNIVAFVANQNPVVDSQSESLSDSLSASLAPHAEPVPTRTSRPGRGIGRPPFGTRAYYQSQNRNVTFPVTGAGTEPDGAKEDDAEEETKAENKVEETAEEETDKVEETAADKVDITAADKASKVNGSEEIIQYILKEHPDFASSSRVRTAPIAMLYLKLAADVCETLMNWDSENHNLDHIKEIQGLKDVIDVIQDWGYEVTWLKNMQKVLLEELQSYEEAEEWKTLGGAEEPLKK